MAVSEIRCATFSLDEVAAAALRWAVAPQATWRCCDLGTVGPRELSALGELAGVGAARDLLGRMSVLEGETFEPPWVVSLPEELRLALAGLGESAIAPLAGRWAETVGMPPAELARTLGALTTFARTSAGPWALRVERAGRRAMDDGRTP